MNACVLVSGALGYIGGYVWQALRSAHMRPVALVRAHSVGKIKSLGLQQHEYCVLHENPSYWACQLAELQATHAVHLAAGPAGVPFVSDDVYAQVLVQLHLPLCMAQAILRNTAPACMPCLVLAGSHWQRVEGQEGRALNVYAAHKTALEQSLKPLAERDGLSVCALRLGDVYGPNDPRGKFLSLLAAASHSGETLALSPGEQHLDWVHVHDVAYAFVHALSPLLGQTMAVYGVGTGKTHSLREVHALWNQMSLRPCHVNWGGRPYRDREVMQTDVGTILPGWHANIDLEQGLHQVLLTYALRA